MFERLPYEILKKIFNYLEFKEQSIILNINKNIYYNFPSSYFVLKCKKIIKEKIKNKYQSILNDYSILVNEYKCIGCKYTSYNEINDDDFLNKNICRGEMNTERKGCHCRLPIFTIKYNNIECYKLTSKIQPFDDEINEIYNLLFEKWILEKLEKLPYIRYNSPWFFCIFVFKDNNNELHYDIPERYFNSKFESKIGRFFKPPYI